MPRRSATSRIALQSRKRQEQAVELRLSGLSYVAIGKKIGISNAQACRLVQAALAERVQAIADQTDELRTVQMAQLDNMLKGLWTKAKRGNAEAVRATLRVLERQAALSGLDAPKKIAPTDPTGKKPYQSYSDEELAKRIAELTAKKSA